MFRYALTRTGDRDVAEDLVQESLLAALRARDRFAERSTEQTWLIGILRHNIAAHFRRSNRELEEEMTDSPDDCWFDGTGHWNNGPSRWPRDPSAVLEDREFWDIVQACLSKLPPLLAEAFCSRELDEMNTEEICRTLDITVTNLGVRLYRARMGLRRCLEANWFETVET